MKELTPSWLWLADWSHNHQVSVTMHAYQMGTGSQSPPTHPYTRTDM